MKRILAAALLALATACVTAGQQTTPPGQPKAELQTPQEQPKTPQEQAKAELGAGQAALTSGNFVEAQQHFERALELDPENKQVRLLIARAIHQQFRQGDTSPENLSKAEEAVAAYKRALEHDPNNDDAHSAVGYIFRQLRDEQREREWLLARAANSSAPAEKRAHDYTALSLKEWQCSRDITDRKENKRSTQGRGPTAFVYVKPQKAEDFERARDCATRGLQYADEAAALAPDFSHAWASKVNLLRELAKLAQMENDEERKAAYEQQAAAALAEQRRASAAAQKRVEEERQRMENAAPAAGPGAGGTGDAPAGEGAAGGTTSPRRPVIAGGVLNGKAVSKPQPAYPEAARAAGAQGTVTVQVMIDEEGAVVSARAVSGHPLLHAAAVEAARQTRFTPTLLSGQPVRVTGVVTFDFVPQ